jgi:hypothetical protein
MDAINPRITIQNAEGWNWLVRFEHDFENGETIDITVKVPKEDVAVRELTVRALSRATELLAALARTTGS